MIRSITTECEGPMQLNGLEAEAVWRFEIPVSEEKTESLRLAWLQQPDDAYVVVPVGLLVPRSSPTAPSTDSLILLLQDVGARLLGGEDAGRDAIIDRLIWQRNHLLKNRRKRDVDYARQLRELVRPWTQEDDEWEARSTAFERIWRHTNAEDDYHRHVHVKDSAESRAFVKKFFYNVRDLCPRPIDDQDEKEAVMQAFFRIGDDARDWRSVPPPEQIVEFREKFFDHFGRGTRTEPGKFERALKNLFGHMGRYTTERSTPEEEWRHVFAHLCRESERVVTTQVEHAVRALAASAGLQMPLADPWMRTFYASHPLLAGASLFTVRDRTCFNNIFQEALDRSHEGGLAVVKDRLLSAYTVYTLWHGETLITDRMRKRAEVKGKEKKAAEGDAENAADDKW